jgi:hypothetical protein
MPQHYELWLAAKRDGLVVAGRVIAWERVEGRIVPVVAWSDGAGMLLAVDRPEGADLWLGGSREAAVDSAQDRQPGDDAPQVL